MKVVKLIKKNTKLAEPGLSVVIQAKKYNDVDDRWLRPITRHTKMKNTRLSK